jgi:hypothetical protein
MVALEKAPSSAPSKLLKPPRNPWPVRARVHALKQYRSIITVAQALRSSARLRVLLGHEGGAAQSTDEAPDIGRSERVQIIRVDDRIMRQGPAMARELPPSGLRLHRW